MGECGRASSEQTSHHRFKLGGFASTVVHPGTMSYSATGAQFPRFLYQYSVPPTLLLLHSTGVLHYLRYGCACYLIRVDICKVNGLKIVLLSGGGDDSIRMCDVHA